MSASNSSQLSEASSSCSATLADGGSSPAPLVVLHRITDVVSRDLVAQMMAEARTKAFRASSASSKQPAKSSATTSRIDSAIDNSSKLLSEASAQLAAPTSTPRRAEEDAEYEKAWHRSYADTNYTIAFQERKVKQLFHSIVEEVDSDSMAVVIAWLVWVMLLTCSLEAIAEANRRRIARER